jgi:hypothetical protein
MRMGATSHVDDNIVVISHGISSDFGDATVSLRRAPPQRSSVAGVPCIYGVQCCRFWTLGRVCVGLGQRSMRQTEKLYEHKRAGHD